MTSSDDTSATRPTVIDLDPDQVVHEAKPEATSEPEGAAPRPNKTKSTRMLPVAFAALLLGAIGGGWLYRDVLSSYVPSNEMTALRERLDMLGKANEQLATQVQAAERLAEQLKADVDVLEANGSTLQADNKTLGEGLTASSGRLATLETQASELRSAIAALANRPATGGAASTPAALPPDIAARLDALEKDVASLKAAVPGKADTATLTQALSDLKAKIEAGAPFADEQARIARMVPAAAGLDLLARHAATGLPAAKGLALELAALTPSLPRPDQPAPVTDPGIWDRMLEALSDVITIRDLGATDWQVVAAKAQAFADSGDLPQAVAAIDEVEGAAPPALQQWRDRAAARLELEAALAAASDSVMRDIAARQ